MPAEAPALVVHYAEIGLKGRNRPDFEAALRRGLERSLRARAAKVRVLRGRLIVFLADGTDARAAAKDAAKVFGVSHVIPAHEAPREPEPLAAAIVARLRERPPAASFAVRTKRADKKYPITSANLNADLGRRIIDAIPMPVCLDDPALAIDVEILEREAWFGFERVPGVGGLPVGASGRVACLLSGGIDSPVASWLMMKRGCQAVFVHFHSAPYTDAASQHKVRDVVRILAALQGKSRLWLVPFLPVQEAIVKGAPPALRVVLYRRAMVRIAAAAAAREGALALATGDSLGQVASQTLENIAAIGDATPAPILRPLIGMDKREIVALAERIGTFETSIEEHQDCCSFLMPPRPATRARAEDCRAAESGLDLAALEAAAIAGAVIETIAP